MKRRKPNARSKGFTLVELLVVLVITAILAVIAVPSILAYMQDGRQTNRSNIARTVYLAAQNRMTELRVTKNLKADLTKEYYLLETDPNTGETIYKEKPEDALLKMNSNVYTALQNSGAEADKILQPEIALGNKPYIHYMSKERGNIDPDNAVVKLLDPVIQDKSVLSEAILIEYNIRTGVILSVFYGDSGDTAALGYGAADRANVVGNRGMNESGYQFAYERRQGYYGVDQTGKIDDPIPALINVYDSSERSLPDDDPDQENNDYDNLLYAEIFVPKKSVTENSVFDLSINGIVVEKGVNLSKYANYANGFDSIFPTRPSNNLDPENDLLLYHYDGLANDIDESMYRYVWILDYVGGNMSNAKKDNATGDNAEDDNLLRHSIGIKYNGQKDAYDENQVLKLDGKSSVRVGISGSVSVESATEAHPYYASDMTGSYTRGEYSVVTARHLYNVRYVLDGKFTQKEDIDLGSVENGISNFAPIGYRYQLINKKYESQKLRFTGKYDGNEHRISNLKIKLPDENLVGLFADIETQTDVNQATVSRVTLQNPNVEGAAQVGALAGRTQGSIDSIVVGYTQDDEKKEDGTAAFVSGAIKGTRAVGGIIGQARGGMLTDLLFVSPNAKTHIAASEDKDTAGGMIGLFTGDEEAQPRMQRALYLALAPVVHDTIQPFVGLASTSDDLPANAVKLYYLSGQVSDQSRPTMVQMGGIADYNISVANIGEPLGSFEMNQLTLLTQLNNKWKLSQNDLKEEQVLDVNNTTYPYPYAKTVEKVLPTHPNWPIVKGVLEQSYPVRVVYYEVYADDSDGKTKEYGFFDPFGNREDKLLPLQDNRKILEDGYFLLCTKEEDLDGIEKELKENKLVLSISSDQGTPNYLDNTKLKDYVQVQKNVSKLGDISGLALNITQLEDSSLGAQTVFMSLGKTAGGDPYFSAFMNPLFAKGIYMEHQDGTAENAYSIRTPRQMKNIANTDKKDGVADRKTAYKDPLKANFIQDINIDFADMNSDAGYQKRIFVTDTGSVPIKTDEAMVASGSKSFEGTFEGNNKANKNLILTQTGMANNLALFEKNNGTIRNVTVERATFTTGRLVGGIVASNTKNINRAKLVGSTLTGTADQTGGIAGENNGYIDYSTVSGSTVEITSGPGKTGGVAGVNNDTVTNTTVIDTKVSNNDGPAGGLAGVNTALLQRSSVQYSTVTSKMAAAGGIAGNNTPAADGGADSKKAEVADVFFLSVADPKNVPVSGAAGSTAGIVGANASGAIVRDTLYIAPAPVEGTGDDATMYPIVGKNNQGIVPKGSFYVQGTRYSLDNGGNWVSDKYNRSKLPVNENGNDNGKGLYSKFMEKEWLNFAYSATLGNNWYQSAAGYIYPLIVEMTKPEHWPVTDGPIRPDQLDRPEDEWAEIKPTSNRSGNVDFINGDFEMDLMDPLDATKTYPLWNATENLWTVLPDPPVTAETTPDNHYAYFPYTWVQGWNTRATDPKNQGRAWWEQIEFQKTKEPTDSFMRVSRDYKGTKDGIYAELNAHYPNTLYQVCKTIPETEMYYSFYHAPRATDTSGDFNLMNFMLTDVALDPDGNWVPKQGENTVIRPCYTRRNILNNPDRPESKRPVYYGRDYTKTPATPMKNKFYDPNTKSMREGYLYDVWLNDLGYGVTFWTEDGFFWDGSYFSGSPKSPWDPGAPQNLESLKREVDFGGSQDKWGGIIGYWDVATFADGSTSQWKQYYGLYNVPKDQITTEFAFAAVRGTALSGGPSDVSGNYIDGISFKSPAFLSIEKVIKNGDTPINFTKPGDEVDVELHLKSWGEVPAGDIVITDKLDPYDEYVSFVNDSVQAFDQNGNSIACTTSGANENSTLLTIKMPPDLKLAKDESIKVTFKLNVRNSLKSNPDVTTLLYYFRNQAEVSYTDAEFTAYQEMQKLSKRTNASNIVQVSIESVDLLKTVSVPDGGVAIDGPFTVNLTVKAAVADLETKGMIGESIPSGFVLSDRGNLPADATVERNPDGSSRLTIRDVNLTPDIDVITYHYELSFEGDGYGVHTISNGTDYRYIFSSGNDDFDVMTAFPQSVVGLRVKTEADACAIDVITEGSTKLFDITANDKMLNKYAHENYNVIPEIVLTDADGKPLNKNADGNYALQTDAYAAVLQKSTNQLQITPKVNADGQDYALYYRVFLTATKPGGNPASFLLDSPVTKIDLSITGSDKVLYFEEYEGSKYGFYTGEKDQSLPPLLNDQKIIKSGYAVLTQDDKRTVRFGPAADEKLENYITNADGTPDIYNITNAKQIPEGYLYILQNPPVPPERFIADNYDLSKLYVKISTNGFMDQVAARIFPNFAKGIYKSSASDAGNTFYIRTPEQMKLIGALIDTTGKTFVQELALDFAGDTTLDPIGAVVKGTFKGTYDGMNKEIKNLVINTTSASNVGLFSINAGTIQNVVVTASTFQGLDFIGTIAGLNDVTGLIKNVKVSNVKILGGTNKGALVGKNDNTAPDSVTGSATGMDGVSNLTALAPALAPPPEDDASNGAVVGVQKERPILDPARMFGLTPSSNLNEQNVPRYRRRRGAS